MARTNYHIVKRAGSVAAALCMAVLTLLVPLSGTPAQAATTINNASLIPKIVPDSQVKLEDGSPDWVKSLIMAEVRLETATEEGTFQSATKLLDHYAEMGVNALWLTPPYADSAVYGAKYPDRIAPKLTGTNDIEKGFAVAKAFVDEAHKRNIRIFFDIVTWGTTKDSPLVTEHPDWYDNWREAYGGYVWRWSNTEWQEWFINNAISIVEKTGIDGYRCDLEPDNTGYNVFDQIRQRLLKKGKKIAIFSEIVNYRYGPSGNVVYDFEQVGVGSDESCQYHYSGYANYFTEHGNIVDCIKTGIGIGTKTLQPSGEGGTFRYYTFCLTCHDSNKPHGNGSRINFGYQMVFAPFIPLWYIGEEWANPKKGTGSVLFYNQIDWSLLDKPENRAFYEDVKKMIRIRRQHPDIFTYFPENHQETNICKVSVKGIEDLGAYARYAGSNGILVVPNANVHDKSGKFEIVVPLAEMGLDNCKKFTVTELMTGKAVVSGTKDQVRKFSFTVPSQEMSIFLVKGEGAPTTTTTTTKNNASTTTRKRPEPATTASAVTSADATSGTDEAASTTISAAPAEETTAPSGEPDNSATEPAATVPADVSAQIDPESNARPGVWIAVGIAAVVLIAGGAVAFILLKKKKSAG